MRRAGWGLGIAIVLVMAAGAWLGFRPYLTREAVNVVFIRPGVKPAPAADALESGFRLAVSESGGRAGRFRLLHRSSEDGTGLSIGATLHIELDDDVAAAVSASEGGDCLGDDHLVVSTLGVDPGTPCFRILPSLGNMGASAARWAKRAGVSRVFVLREMFDEGIGAVTAGFETEAKRVGIVVPAAEPVHDPVESVAEEVLEAGPDCVFYGGERAPFSRMAHVFAALRHQGYRGRLVMADVDIKVSMLDAPGPLVEGTYLVSPLAPAPADFVPKYRAFAGKDPGPHVYYGYLGGRAALGAIAAANSRDPGTVRRAAASLPQFDGKGETRTNFPALYVVKEGRFEFVEVLK